MPLTAEKFAEGFTGAEYWDRIRVNKDAILQIYNDVEVQPEVQAYFDSLPQPLRLAVFTEPWCGDAVSSTRPSCSWLRRRKSWRCGSSSATRPGPGQQLPPGGPPRDTAAVHRVRR